MNTDRVIKKLRSSSGCVARSLIAGSLLVPTADLRAQAKISPASDAQVEASVLQALAGNPKLANQHVSTTSVFGVVTLSGEVSNEEARGLAEDVISRVPGVKKVIDELTIGALSQAAQSDQDQGSTPQLQSDGTLAPAEDGTQNGVVQQDGSPSPTPQTQGSAPVQRSSSAQQDGYGVPEGSSQPYPGQARAPGEPVVGLPNLSSPYPPSSQPSYGQQRQAPYALPGQPAYGQPPYAQSQQTEPPYRRDNTPPYGPPGYGAGTADPYGQHSYDHRTSAYGGQVAGLVIHVPAGATLQVRLTEGVDSKYAQVGNSFTGVVASDVVTDGLVAIPRGASVQGTVTDATHPGVLKGRASLSLQLTQVTLSGRVYALSSSTWLSTGGDKITRTVESGLGLGAVGAIIGGVAGGGAGAAIGAGAGGAAGIGASAAAGGGQIFLPPEAVLSFQLTQQADLTTVSQAEMQRLASGTQNGTITRRRMVPPPYPYGPGYVYYPRYYYRPYYRPYGY